jgi:hypothetical protein
LLAVAVYAVHAGCVVKAVPGTGAAAAAHLIVIFLPVLPLTPWLAVVLPWLRNLAFSVCCRYSDFMQSTEWHCALGT